MKQNGKLTYCIITCNKHQMTENDDLCPSAGHWMNKLGYFPTTEHHAPAKKKKKNQKTLNILTGNECQDKLSGGEKARFKKVYIVRKNRIEISGIFVLTCICKMKL